MKLLEDYKIGTPLKVTTTDGQKWKVKFKGREGRSIILHDGVSAFKFALRHVLSIEIVK